FARVWPAGQRTGRVVAAMGTPTSPSKLPFTAVLSAELAQVAQRRQRIWGLVAEQKRIEHSFAAAPPRKKAGGALLDPREDGPARTPAKPSDPEKQERLAAL